MESGRWLRVARGGSGALFWVYGKQTIQAHFAFHDKFGAIFWHQEKFGLSQLRQPHF